MRVIYGGIAAPMRSMKALWRRRLGLPPAGDFSPQKSPKNAAGAAAPAPHGAGPGPRPRYGGPPAQLPRLRRGFRGVLGLGPPAARWAAAGLARRPCLSAGLRPRPGPLRPPGPRWPWLGPPPPGAARARGSGGCGGFPALPPAPGVARPIGGPPAPVGAAPSLPRRAPLRRGRVRPPAAVPRRGLGPLLGGSGPGGSCRLPPPVGGAALLPPPGLRPFPCRAGSPSPGPCRAARLPPWAAAPPPSGGGWGRLRRPFPRRRPLRGGRSC